MNIINYNKFIVINGRNDITGAINVSELIIDHTYERSIVKILYKVINKIEKVKRCLKYCCTSVRIQ